MKHTYFFIILSQAFWAPLVAQRVKNLPAVQGNQVQSLDWEDPLEKGKATHSGVPAWRIHGQRSLAGYSPWDQRVRHDQVTNTHTLLTVHLRFIFLNLLFVLEYNQLALYWQLQVDCVSTWTCMYHSPQLASHPGCHTTLSRAPCTAEPCRFPL